MKASRNDPCPCGSGKKYKACCMNMDAARERVRSTVGGEAFEAFEARMREQAAEPVWEADVFTPGAASPSLALVSAGGIILQGETLPRRATTPERQAEAIAQAVSAAGRVYPLPRRLHVRDAQTADLLRPRLRPRGVEVHDAPIPQLDEALESVMEMMGGPPMAARLGTPDTWRETGASGQELAEFHRAAAEFHRLAPWKTIFDPLLLEMPQGGAWGASVMGDAGVALGLALYSDPDDLEALLMADEPHLDPPPMEGYALTVDLDRKEALSRPMQREIIAGGWTVAAPRAYPRIFALNTPGRRVTAEHVRQATLCLRAVSAHGRGADPQAETGVRVERLLDLDAWDEDDGGDEDDRLGYFPCVETAGPVCAEGPGADPHGALRAWGSQAAVETAEEERLARMQAWLREGPHADAATDADLENARAWTDCLLLTGVPAGAVTEHDLRLFIYDLYLRKRTPSDAAIEALRGSLSRIFRFLEEREGIRYPFAPEVLAELDDVAQQGQADGRSLGETLAALACEVHDDLQMRAMLHERLPLEGLVSWPDLMNADVATLDRELQRRWLLWYDEAVRSGITDVGEVQEVLLARQLAWENAPHTGFDGRTPAEVVRAYLASDQYLGKDWQPMAGG